MERWRGKKWWRNSLREMERWTEKRRDSNDRDRVRVGDRKKETEN